MDWKDCASQRLDTYLESRFKWPTPELGGFDCNPDFTFSDIWGAISWIWTYPGDYLLSMPGVRSFFEMEGFVSIGSTWSTVLTWIFLILLLNLIRE